MWFPQTYNLKKKKEAAVYVRHNKAKLNKRCVLINYKAEIEVQAI